MKRPLLAGAVVQPLPRLALRAAARHGMSGYAGITKAVTALDLDRGAHDSPAVNASAGSRAIAANTSSMLAAS
jgi:hypothetical protein